MWVSRGGVYGLDFKDYVILYLGLVLSGNLMLMFVNFWRKEWFII